MAAARNAGRASGPVTPARWAQIEEVFHCAVGCDAECRAALVDELCGEDRELREEVEALISCDQRAAANLHSAISCGLHAFSFPKSGEIISHYRILGGLGGGGMGVVYEAQDAKLRRHVALKFLPEELANDFGAMERFEREARAASALNHPNICTIHAVEEHEGQPFIVMELLEGRTLRDVLSEGEAAAVSGVKRLIPVGDLLDTGIQIADGLEAAHKKGIIHRDIKPANIFVTNQGQVKILDFGLAKLREFEALEVGETDSLTRTGKQLSGLDLTRTGLAMGTAGYMSPEQVRGEKLDARSDLFSLGLVLYEMAAGRRAFLGETDAELRAAILDQIPERVLEYNAKIPPQLEKVIDHALAKNREGRYQTAAEIRANLQAIREGIQTEHPKSRAVLWPAAAALLVIALVSVWYATKRPPSGPIAGKWRQRQLTVNTSENPVTGGAISPDGKYLVYADLYGMHLKLIASGEVQAVAVPNTDERERPNWSTGAWLPDSRHYYAIADLPLQPSALWIISVAGGVQQKIATGVAPWGVSPDGSLLAVTMENDHEIWLMKPNGENPRKLLTSGDGSRIRAVQWAPDGTGVAYVRNRESNGTNEAQIEFADVQTGTPRVLLSGKAIEDVSRLDEGLQDMTWLPDGRLIFSGGKPDIHGASCNLWQSRIDLNAYRASFPERITDWSGFCVNNLGQTADGKKLVFNRSMDLLLVYVADFDAAKVRITQPRKLTFTEDISSPAGWTPDSREVLIRSNREGSWGLYRRAIDKDADTPIITGREGMSYWAPVTPDHQWILFKEPVGSDPRRQKLMRVPVQGGAAQEVLEGQEFRVGCPQRASGTCVMAELSADRKELIFRALDAIQGRGPELARFSDEHAEEYELQLAPDGTQAVLHVPFTKEFVLFSLKQENTRRLVVKGDMHLRNVTWAPDGRGLFAANNLATGAELVHVDLQGNARVLWTVNGSNVFLVGKASPDGLHVAIQTSAGNSNMWMAENF